MKSALLLLTVIIAQAAVSHPEPPQARQIAPDTFLLPGAMLPDRGPDGNTVIFTAPEGLVVVDTGRHPWQSDGILAFAREKKQPVVAIVNTHWHLDHSSGNGRVKAAYPAAKVYTTRAVDRALSPGGFLTRNYEAAKSQPPSDNATRREESDLFMATMKAADGLRPDVAIERSGPLALGRRPLIGHVTDNAVTDADVWVYDEATGVAVIGDLVTLPAPFFETACPARWQAALGEVLATPFKSAVPGHGEVMTRDDLKVYLSAFSRFRTCAGSETAPASCAAAWTNDVGALLHSDADRKQATDYASYYVGFLRKGNGASADCQAK